jgi:DNA end-binding protein Ku
VQPLALAGAAHHEQVAFAGHDDDVVGRRTGGDPVHRDAALEARPQHERSAHAEHDDRDQGVVEPAHLTVAVKSLEVLPVPVEKGADAGELDAKARAQVEIGLMQQWEGVGPHAHAQPLLRHVVVVAEDLGLLPCERVVQLGERGVGVTHEPAHEVDPGVRRERDPIDGGVAIDAKLLGRGGHPSSIAPRLAHAPSGYSRVMPRAMWSGSISFGLVNVPVKAYTGVRDHTIHFHQLDKKTGARVEYKKVSSESGRKLEADDIEKGYEITKGKYVVVDEEEFEQLRPRSTRTIDVTDFVELGAIDPIYYANTYWLGTDGEGGARAYRLLLEAMEKKQRVAIGTVVMRNKQYLAAIRPLDGALAMSTMRFADEVVPRDELDDIPSANVEPTDRELRLASQIIDSLTTDWEPSRYADTYTDELRDLIEAKAKGKEVTVEPDTDPGAKVLDLMEALKASVEEHRNRAGARPTGRKKASSAKRSTSKRTPAKRATKSSASKRRSA